MPSRAGRRMRTFSRQKSQKHAATMLEGFRVPYLVRHPEGVQGGFRCHFQPDGWKWCPAVLLNLWQLARGRAMGPDPWTSSPAGRDLSEGRRARVPSLGEIPDALLWLADKPDREGDRGLPAKGRQISRPRGQ